MIAAELGCAVSEAYRRVVAGIHDTYRESALQMGVIEGEKLDLLERTAREAFEVATPEQKPRILDTLIRLSERRAKLFGLDAPKKVDVQNTGKVEVVYVDDWGDPNAGAGTDPASE